MPVFFASAEDEYKKHKDLKKEDVKAIMAWMKMQQHLPALSEYQVIFFLHSCYFRIEPTKVCIENFLTIKTHTPEIFENRSLSLIKEISNTMLVTLLPKKTPEGYSILFVRLLDANPEKFDFNLMHMLIIMVTSLATAQLGTSDGHVIVIDSTGYSFGHLMKINVALTRKLLFYLQEGIPVRLVGIHVINVHPAIEKAYSLLKPFLHKYLLELINIHLKTEHFYEIVSRELLPLEYGGFAGTLEELKEKTLQNLLDNERFFQGEDKLLVDESKRLRRSKFLDEVNASGLDGSFKQLEID